MYAVIKTGGKQYRVAPDDVLSVEKVAGEAGDIVEFNEVLLVAGDKELAVGAPMIADACVAAEVIEQERARKIKVFKKKRRKGYRRTHGHRQMLTKVKITEILTDGKKPSAAKPAREPAKAKGEAQAKGAAKPVETKAAKPKAKTEAAPKKAAPKKAVPKKAAAPKAEAKKAPAKTAAKKPAAKKKPKE
jgi:large subunit ribosomal protein L21